jgi:hypothetical protein
LYNFIRKFVKKSPNLEIRSPIVAQLTGGTDRCGDRSGFAALRLREVTNQN